MLRGVPAPVRRELYAPQGSDHQWGDRGRAHGAHRIEGSIAAPDRLHQGDFSLH